MSIYYAQYFSLLIYLLLSTCIAFVFFLASYIIASHNGYIENLSAYECGFDPFSDASNTFDVSFYLVALLFIIFDLEISFLFPWSVCLLNLPLYSFWFMVLFLIILVAGFIYELNRGVLDWN